MSGDVMEVGWMERIFLVRAGTEMDAFVRIIGGRPGFNETGTLSESAES